MKKILIADDRSETRELVRVTLAEEEYEIFEARDGSEALQTVRRIKPDLLVLDVMMPGDLDGYQVCRLIKEDEDTCGTVVIMLTAKGQDVDRGRGFQCGADGYFTKPFSPLQLLKKVAEVLDGERE